MGYVVCVCRGVGGGGGGWMKTLRTQRKRRKFSGRVGKKTEG